MQETQTKNIQGAHGGEVFRIARESGIATDAINDFSSNANSLCRNLTEELLFAAPQDILEDYNRYPDTYSAELTQRIADHEDVACDEILVGHGSTETIFLTFQQLAPERVLLIGPMFSEYEKACQIFAKSYDVLTCPSEDNFAVYPKDIAERDEYDLVVFCSPNNPATITYPNMQELLATIPAKAVLIDSTYREFLYGEPEYDATATSQYRAWCRQETRLITMHSFTKFFYCTGIRLGYAVSDNETIALLKHGKMPWTVTALAQKAGLVFLKNIERYRVTLPQMREYRAMFRDEIEQTGAFAPEKIFDGVNYLFCRLKTPSDGNALYEYLLSKSILIRLCDNIPGTEQGFIRMQVKTPEEWKPIVTALHEWTASK